VDVPTLYRGAASSPARDDLAVEVEHAPSAVNAPASIARQEGMSGSQVTNDLTSTALPAHLICRFSGNNGQPLGSP
jgi:hypothetical protein